MADSSTADVDALECSVCHSSSGPFSKRQIKKASAGELARCIKCIENETPIKSKAASNNDEDAAALQAELQQVKAVVASSTSTCTEAASNSNGTKRSREDTPKSISSQDGNRSSGIATNADFTFGNGDETPTPIPKRKRQAKKQQNGDGPSLISAMVATSASSPKTSPMLKETPNRKSNPFIDDEAGDHDDDFEDDRSYGGEEEDGEGVSLEALKRQILGRKLVTTPGTPHSNHEELYLKAEKVKVRVASSKGNSSSSSSSSSSSTVNGANTSQYIIPSDLRKELNCPICHETLYQPVSLPCGHNFCCECMQWWLERNRIPQSQRISAADANHGSCPTCRTPLPFDGRELSINTSLRACVAALLGEELTERVLEERRKRLQATRGERGGAHDSGYDVIVPSDEEEWKKLGYKLTFRRSTVLDANDQRMQLSLGLWGGPSGNEPLRYDGQRLELSLCLLSLEEDEVTDGGFPRMIRDEDDEHLVCSSENRFTSTFVTALAKSSDSSVQVGVENVNDDGIAEFSLDMSIGACSRASTLLFLHRETGALFEVKIPRDRDSGDVNERLVDASPTRSRSYFRHDDDNSDHDSEDEFEDDGFVVIDEDENEEEMVEDEEDGDADELCCICKKHGELLICDGGDHLAGCARSFHVSCVDRVEVPEGDWVCERCARAFGLDVGIEGHEFPSEGDQDGNDATHGSDGEAASQSGNEATVVNLEGSSDEDEESSPRRSSTDAEKNKKKTVSKRKVIEDSSDDDDSD